MSYTRASTSAVMLTTIRNMVRTPAGRTGRTASIQTPMPKAQPAMNVATSVSSIGSL
jgi:hypothetical protein